MNTSMNYMRWIIIMVMFSFVLVDVKGAQALSPTFNPSYVLEDSEFSSDMSEAQVQDFLTGKGSFFANYSDPAGHGSAAHVIWQLARDGGISPRVILVTAQKESSSISSYKDMNAIQTDSNGNITAPNGVPYGTKADWFLFCGWTESTVMTQFKGFYNQVQCAVKVLSVPFTTGVKNDGKRVGDSQLIDGQTITYENAATLALYNYTPHIQTNFYNIWKGFLSDPNFITGGDPCPAISAWKGEFYNNMGLSGTAVLCRNDNDINFDWGSGSPGNGVNADGFSARWTRTMYFNSGTYLFHMVGDDGVQLYLDGNLIRNEWRDQSPTQFDFTVPIQAGNHAIELRYYENGGGAVAKLWWELVSTGGGTCPAITAWKGEYYNNMGLSGAVALCRNDNDINFDWGGGSPGTGVNADNFSARWTRTVSFAAGTYKFHVVGDDGVQLSLDNNLIVDQWKDQGPTEYTFQTYMNAGNHTIELRYYENGGGAVAKLWWELISTGGGTCPAITAWKGEYYNNKDLSGAVALCRNDNDINFDWGGGSPGTGVNADNFSARWTRTVSFAAGTYKFHVVGDDGVRLSLDNNLIVNEWHDQGPTEYTFQTYMNAGNHTIELRYYENGGGAVAKLWWELISAGGGTCPAITAWKGEYYNNMGLSGAIALCRNDNDINFDWGGGSPGTGVNADNFSARWTRTIDFGTTGVVTFIVRTDDGIRVFLNDSLIINQWNDQGPTEYRVGKFLGGVNTIKVEYYENGGGAVAQFHWEKSGSSGNTNLALNKSVSATSQESSSYPPSNGNDGNINTRWSSQISTTLGEQWYIIDLGSPQPFNQLLVRWEAAYAAYYFIGWSDDRVTFNGYYRTLSAKVDDVINVGAQAHRYVGIYMITRAPKMNNFSFYEFEVYNR